jgi:HEAT repeat protein
MPRRTDEEQATYITALQSIADEQELSVEQLDALSVLEGPDLDRFVEVWNDLSAPARARLIRRLHVAAEQRLRLDFNAINQVGLRDADDSVRLAAVQCTIEDRSLALLRQLLEAVRTDPSIEVRLAAAEDLSRFTLLAELDELDPESTQALRSRLIEAVHDESEDSRVRAAALAALGYFSDEQVAAELIGGFSQPLMRLGAVRGMGRTADPSWTDRLMPVLGSDDVDLRREAASALGEIEDERAVTPLVEIIDDPEHQVRLAVIEALGHIGGEEAREALMYVAEDPNDAIRDAAERALGEIEEAEEELDAM